MISCISQSSPETQSQWGTQRYMRARPLWGLAHIVTGQGRPRACHPQAADPQEPFSPGLGESAMQLPVQGPAWELGAGKLGRGCWCKSWSTKVGGALTSGHRRDACISSQRKSETSASSFLLYQGPQQSVQCLPTLVRSDILYCLLTQMLVSARNTLTDTPEKCFISHLNIPWPMQIGT